MQLNNSHPLYGNLKLLVGIDEGNNLVDLVTARTFTIDPDASFGTGTYGRHFRTAGVQYNPNGAAFAPAFAPSNNTGTLLVVTNGTTYAQNDSYRRKAAFIGPPDSNDCRLPILHIASTGKVAASCYSSALGDYNQITGTSDFVLNSARMLSIVRNGVNACTLYVNNAAEATDTQLGTDTTSSISWSKIGGLGGYAGLDSKIVWIAWFDKALTAQEISDLYTSLGPNNAISLVVGASANATAPGAGLSGPASIAAGSAKAGGSAVANGAALTATSSLGAGNAIGGSTGSFTTEAMENNTGAGVLVHTTVAWTWWQGSIGLAPTSLTHGTGTTDASGILRLSGLPAGTGFLIVRTADGSGVYYQPGTVT